MTIKVGQKAPDFTLADNQGGQVKLSDLKGKKVLLSWHPWPGPACALTRCAPWKPTRRRLTS